MYTVDSSTGVLNSTGAVSGPTSGAAVAVIGSTQ